MRKVPQMSDDSIFADSAWRGYDILNILESLEINKDEGEVNARLCACSNL